MGTFEAFYASPMQHPFLLWAAAAAALCYVATRREVDPSVRRYCGVLGVLSLLDAWLSSSHIYGIGSLSGTLASVVPLFFVLAGDFRFLLLAVSATPGGRITFSGRSGAQALGLTVIVPISTQLVLRLLPDSLDTPRVMFFLYEVSFVVLTLCLLRFHAGVAENPWTARVSRFVIVYYSLWATADLIILIAGADLGYLLRVVPNALYYGGLIAAMAHYAPAPRTDN
jgi:hypothetical protein